MTTTTNGLPLDRKVDNRVYSDPEVYRREVAQIFERSWLFACHESEVAETGDFVSTSLGGSPILVTRDGGGRVRGFFNVCRHRGCKVVLDEAGHASASAARTTSGSTRSRASWSGCRASRPTRGPASARRTTR